MSEIAPRRSTKLLKSSPSPIDAEIRRNYANALLAGLCSTMAAKGTCLMQGVNIGALLISGDGVTVFLGRYRRAPKKAHL